MKSFANISYFPIDAAEQALLLRLRERGLLSQGPQLLEMLDQLAAARLCPADLDQAIQLLEESRRGEGLDARFDNLEARLKERIERGLSEIEGRLSKSLAGPMQAAPPSPPSPNPAPAQPKPRKRAAQAPEAQPTPVPPEACLAIRIGPDLVWGATGAEFYLGIWRWLFEHGRVKDKDLPIKTGRARYAVATEPTHLSGKAFFAGRELLPGVWVEVHASRENLLGMAEKFLKTYQVSYEVVVGVGS